VQRVTVPKASQYYVEGWVFNYWRNISVNVLTRQSIGLMLRRTEVVVAGFRIFFLKTLSLARDLLAFPYVCAGGSEELRSSLPLPPLRGYLVSAHNLYAARASLKGNCTHLVAPRIYTPQD